jgi:hypothetical protein
MHANPQRVPDEEPGPTLHLLEQPGTTTLAPLVFRFINLLRKALWRAFQHDAFAIAKASAYSSILTFFPTLLVLGSVLAQRRNTQPFSRKCRALVRAAFHYLTPDFLARFGRHDFVDGGVQALL